MEPRRGVDGTEPGMGGNRVGMDLVICVAEGRLIRGWAEPSTDRTQDKWSRGWAELRIGWRR